MAPTTRSTRRNPVSENIDTNSPEDSFPRQKTRKTPRKTKAITDGSSVSTQPLHGEAVLASSQDSQGPTNRESTKDESALKDAMVKSVRGFRLQPPGKVDDTLQPGQMKMPFRPSPTLAPTSLPDKASHKGAFSQKTPQPSDNDVLPQTPTTSHFSLHGSRSVSPFSYFKPHFWPSESKRTSWSSQESFGSPPRLPDDKLPKDAQECVRWLTEYAIEHGLEGTLSTDIGPEFSSHFASFDPDGFDELDFHSPTTSGFDLKTSFAQMVAGGSRKLYARGVRKWVEEPEQREWKAETEKLVDEMLKEITTPEEEIDVKWDLDQKLGYLAGRQNRKQLFENTWGVYGPAPKHFDIFNPVDKNRNACEFQVNVRYLIGGYGHISRVITIYLDYMTPFYEFLKDLQDLTSACEIPPKDSLNPQIIVHKMPPKNAEAETRDDESSVMKEAQDTEDSIMEDYNPELVDERNPDLSTIPNNILEPDPSQETFSSSEYHNESMGGARMQPRDGFMQWPARGYTLEHGPWLYSRGMLAECDEHAPKLGEEWSKIENEQDYKSMVRALYEANKTNLQAAKEKPASRQNSRNTDDENPETTHVLHIMHSLDYERHLNALKRKENEKKEDDEWCEMWRNIPKKHDIEPGQPWSVYMEEWYEKHPEGDPLQFLEEHDASSHGF